MAILIPSLPKIERRSYTYTEWYDMYYDEINEIVENIIECIMDGFCSESLLKKEKQVNTIHSLNIKVFSERLKRKLYQTSDNRFKDTAGIWE